MTVTPERIKEARKAKRLTQQEVADKLSIPRSSYAIKEKTGDFTASEIETLTKCLEILENNSTEAAKESPGSEYQGKYIGVIEKLLDQDLKEIKIRLEAIEQTLKKIADNFATAEARQKAAFVLTQWLTEEIASIPRNEKDRKKLVSEARKQIHERLEATLQEHK